MALKFNAPPTWPQPPEGWLPPEGWRPDLSWPPAPPGWEFMVDEPVDQSEARRRRRRMWVRLVVIAVVLSALAALALVIRSGVLGPDDANDPGRSASHGTEAWPLL